jgi:hypothetical protein
MSRQVLLLEPNYHNKYPPMGLMKLATYHRMKGDQVRFFKGVFKDLIIDDIANDAIVKLTMIDGGVNWRKFTPEIKSFFLNGCVEFDSTFERATERPFILKWLKYFREYYRQGQYFKSPRWDRVCVTTLFTFYWNITIDTIKFAQSVCKSPEQVLVGGILASVVPDEVEKDTGIKPFRGIIHDDKLLNDAPVDRPIDQLPLDYSILDEIDYQYPASDAYFGYTTRGCVNRCEFCAVPVIEPSYQSYISLNDKIAETRHRFGERKNLLLLDNNVFASDDFDKIIDEIYNSGFAKDSLYTPPNHLDITVTLLKSSWNDRAAVRRIVNILEEYILQLTGSQYDRIYSLLLDYGLLHDYTATKENILTVWELIKEDYAQSLRGKHTNRYVDFNQGVDARRVTEEKIKKLSTIAIRPLRIAFDRWALRKEYITAVKLAAKYEINNLSNYLLYNFNDHPVDLYRRLLLNIDLSECLKVNIYSFPMKYHPIQDLRYLKNRNFIGKQWSKKAIRTVQAILNSTSGKIGVGRAFFHKAFGRNEDEFLDMIHMPEAFILKRWDAEVSGQTAEWKNSYTKLSKLEKANVDKIVNTYDLSDNAIAKCSPAEKNVLRFYLKKYDDVEDAPMEKKKKHRELFESLCPEITPENRALIENC